MCEEGTFDSPVLPPSEGGGAGSLISASAVPYRMVLRVLLGEFHGQGRQECLNRYIYVEDASLVEFILEEFHGQCHQEGLNRCRYVEDVSLVEFIVEELHGHLGGGYVPCINRMSFRRRLGSLLCACSTMCDVTCSSAVTSLLFVVVA